MRSGALLFLLLTPALVPLAGSQAPSTVHLSIVLGLNVNDGTVDVEVEVADRGNLVTLELDFGGVTTVRSGPELVGSWTTQGDVVKADLKKDAAASARWVADGRVNVVSVEGEGRTSHVGTDFAVLKPADLMPEVQYAFPEGSPPTFRTTLRVLAPQGWIVKTPWPPAGEGFDVDNIIPRGFIVADDDLTESTLGEGATAYRIVRVGGATEPENARAILATAETFLGGLYGVSPDNRFIVVAPDPMFRGGLGSPSGVFLHADADQSVVAHEMVHAYQAFQPSRTSGTATVWLAEGTAVVHGLLLEVAADVLTREQAQESFGKREREAREKHEIDLSTAIYGSPGEPAAYTKGAVVTTALNDAILQATSRTFTLSDVLRRLNDDARAAAPAEPEISNAEVLDAIGDVTGFDLADFFRQFVTGRDVPRAGVLFPGQAAVRLVGTTPDPPIALEPFSVRVALTNLDVDELLVDVPVLVNGTEAGRVVATLAAGAAVEATAAVSPLPRGSYHIAVDRAGLIVRVAGPPALAGALTLWPEVPVADRPATVGVFLQNKGEAPYEGRVQLVVQGNVVADRAVRVVGGASETVTTTVPPLGLGAHDIVARTAEGTVLDAETVTVTANAPRPTPAGLVLALTALAGAALLGRARSRTR